MRAEKKQLVQDIKALIESSSSLFLVSYSGLTARQFGALRRLLAEANSECHVVPNRLFSIAAQQGGVDALADVSLSADTALVTGGQDPVAVAKVLRDFGKTNDKMAVKTAVVAGKLCSPEQAKALADLPPLEVLQAQLLGLLMAPAGQLVRVLSAKVSSVVYVLNAYLSEKEQAA